MILTLHPGDWHCPAHTLPTTKAGERAAPSRPARPAPFYAVLLTASIRSSRSRHCRAADASLPLLLPHRAYPRSSEGGRPGAEPWPIASCPARGEAAGGG